MRKHCADPAGLCCNNLQASDETDGRADEDVADDGANDEHQKDDADEYRLCQTVAETDGRLCAASVHDLHRLLIVRIVGRLVAVDYRQPRRRSLLQPTTIHWLVFVCVCVYTRATCNQQLKNIIFNINYIN